jgi:hypothetical protein
LAIRLGYSLSLDGVNRKLTLPEQLTIFGLNTIKSPIPMPIYTDNFNIPSVLFLIGFIVGDCSLLIRLRLVESGSVLIIPLLSLAQLNNALNPHLFTMFAYLFKSLGINVNIKNCTELEKKTSTFYNNCFFFTFLLTNPAAGKKKKKIQLFFKG